MNIEVTVAEWLDASSADVTVEDNLFISNLPADTQEGICVMLNRQLQSFDSVSRANIQILMFYFDYIEGRDLMKSLIDLLDDYRGMDITGTDGDWAVAGPVYGDNLGTDVKNRNVFSIEFEVAYKEG